MKSSTAAAKDLTRSTVDFIAEMILSGSEFQSTTVLSMTVLGRKLNLNLSAFVFVPIVLNGMTVLGFESWCFQKVDWNFGLALHTFAKQNESVLLPSLFQRFHSGFADAMLLSTDYTFLCLIHLHPMSRILNTPSTLQ